MGSAQKSAWGWDTADIHLCHHHQGQHHLLLQAGIGAVRAARSVNSDPATVSSQKHLPRTSNGQRAVPGSEQGNWADTTKSDWLAAKSDFPSLPVWPLDPIVLSSRLWCQPSTARCTVRKGDSVRRLYANSCSPLTYQVISTKSFSSVDLSFFVRKFTEASQLLTKTPFPACDSKPLVSTHHQYLYSIFPHE